MFGYGLYWLNKFGLLGDNNDPIIKEPTTENIKLYYEGLEDKLRVATVNIIMLNIMIIMKI